ncbi:MAG: M28 family peptidase [Pyrinomonadaceae bacterium]
MRKNLIAGFLGVALLLPTAGFAQAPAVKITPAEKKAAEAVTAKQLSDYLYFVASDEMEGRDTPSRGLDTVAKFIGMNLDKWGFKPAGDDGSFYQKISLVRDVPDAANSKLEIAGRSFVAGTDFVRGAGSGSVSGSLVFGGSGWSVKAKGMDPLAGVDAKGKIVVFTSAGGGRNAMPAGLTRADLTGQRGVDWADPMTNAERAGAVAVIMIGGATLNQNTGGRGPGYAMEKLRPAASMPVINITTTVADAIFAGESGDRNGTAGFALSKSANANIAVKRETASTQNVVALWEGSDPTLKSEMVAIGAHYDHVGVNLNAPGPDKIWNGADDDGSGTVAVLSIAEALAKAPTRPKRSVLFVWHCGEEKGLWGSEYFNKFPTVDIKKVIAQLNIDMIGRSRAAGNTEPKDKDLTDGNTIYVIGKDMMSSTLGAIVDGANKGYLNMNYDTRYDDPKDTNRFFFRSDHFNYAVNGIPIAFWFDGVHVDYHGPADTADKIDYPRMEKITRTIFLTLWELTDLKERPKIDKQLPPELSAR